MSTIPQNDPKHRIGDILNTLSNSLNSDHHSVANHLVEVIKTLGTDPRSSHLHLIAKELLRAIVREIEVPIRATIAAKLCDDASVSKELVKILANDQIEVAWCVLEGSSSLNDEDLVEIATSQTPRHRLAIAKRKVVSALVSSSLICFGEKETIGSVLQNPNADLSERAFEQICVVAKRHPELQELLVKRHDLPLSIAFAMLEWIAEALHVYIYERISREPRGLRRIIHEAISAPSVALSLHYGVKTLIECMVSKESGWSGDDVTTVMSGLPVDRLDLKIAVASDYIYEPLQSMRDIVLHSKGDMFATVCRAADVPTTVFESMLEHLFLCRKGYDGYPLNDAGFVLAVHRTFTSKTSRQARAELARSPRTRH